MIWHHAGPPVSPADLDRIQQLCGRPLSTALREFYLRTNGGIPECRLVHVPDYADPEEIHCVFAIGHVVNGDWHLEQAIAALPEYVSGGLLPFADTASNCLLCINQLSTNGETVVLVDIADPLDSRGMKRLWPVADTLADFLAGLT